MLGAGKGRIARFLPMRLKLLAAGLSLVLVASLAGCSDDGDDGSASDTTSDAPGSTTTTTADGSAEEPATGVVASGDERADEIVQIVEDALPELALQSVVFGVWVGDEEIVRGAVDVPSPNVGPTAVDALVRVGQPMEAMLGTVLILLDEEGVVDMDEPVEQYLPDLVNADEITPRMLANSTSGTPDFVPNQAFEDRANANPFAPFTYEELLDFAQQDPPLFEPGTGWSYSHTDMASLVEVLTQASGMDLGELMATYVFEPLGMDDSAAYQDATIGTPAFRAFTNGRGVYEESTTWDPSWGLNGGMNASVADLGRWLRALNDGELLTPEDAELSLAPDPDGLTAVGSDGSYFAFGSLVAGNWVIGNPSLNGYQGFTAQHRDPSITIVVWSTAAPNNTGDSNASVDIAARISQVVSPDDPVVPPGG